MKTLFFTITCITFVTLTFLPNSFAQEYLHGRLVVRLIYFLPNDRPFRPEVEKWMKNEIRNLQRFFAEQMQAHGFGNRTFPIETDAQDEPMVHRVDGKHPSSYYHQGHQNHELGDLLDGDSIFFLVLDGGGANYGAGHKNRGGAVVAGTVSRCIAAHEMAHSFGLNWHQYNQSDITGESMSLSACHAEFLSVHPCFNPDVPIEWRPPVPADIELISPRTYPVGSESVLIQLKVNYSAGLHQVFLFVQDELKACRNLKGKKDAVVEFNYDGVIPSQPSTSLSNPIAHSFRVIAIDTEGNKSTLYYFTLAEDSPDRIAILEGYTGTVSVAFSPDGVLLASGGSDHISGGWHGEWADTVRLWDVATRTNIATLKGHTNTIHSVAFSPDGILLASGSNDGTVRLWDVATRTSIATLEGHKTGGLGTVRSVAFSPDGVLLASGSNDETVKLWNVVTRTNIATLEGHLTPVTSVAFSPNGAILASGSYPTTKLWDIATRTNIGVFGRDERDPGERGVYVKSVAFSPDGVLLVIGGERIGRHALSGKVELWDVTTRQRITTFVHGEQATSVAFSPDGALIAAGAVEGVVYLWDIAKSTPIATFGYPGVIASVAFSPRGVVLASGSNNGTFHNDDSIQLWDISSYITPNTPLKFRDVNQDGVVDTTDWLLVAAAQGQKPPINPRTDVNGDGKVDVADILLVADAIVGDAGAPSLYPMALKLFIASDVQRWLHEARQIVLITPAHRRGILILEQLLALLTPKETALLVNYPNPFNPETWIPYQLAAPADVTLTIYAADGAVVRTLELGHRSAGIYQDRSRAAYWDGRNEVGEPVASGVYFYTLSAGDFTATRKMLIRK